METITAESRFDAEDYRKHYSLLTKEYAKAYGTSILSMSLSLAFVVPVGLVQLYALGNSSLALQLFPLAATMTIGFACIYNLYRTVRARRDYVRKSLGRMDRSSKTLEEPYRLEFNDSMMKIYDRTLSEDWKQVRETEYSWDYFRGYRRIGTGILLVGRNNDTILFGEKEFPPEVNDRFFSLISQKLAALHESKR